MILAMTQQIPDYFYYEGTELNVVGIEGTGLYTPKDFGIDSIPASTACYRGYFMKYEIKDNQLFMEGFLIRTLDGIIPPDINNKSPNKITREYNPMGLCGLGFRFEYKDIYLKIPFNGTLILGNKIIREEYVHMGYPSATSFQTVLKFTFEEGTIVKVEDISERVREIREHEGDPKGYTPNSDNPEDIRKWIEERFSLKTDL